MHICGMCALFGFVQWWERKISRFKCLAWPDSFGLTDWTSRRRTQQRKTGKCQERLTKHIPQRLPFRSKTGVVWQWHICPFCVPGGLSEDPLPQEVILSEWRRGWKTRVVFMISESLLWHHTRLCWFSAWCDLNYPVSCVDVHCCKIPLILGFIKYRMSARQCRCWGG